MGWIIAGGLVLLYFAASTSRKRKQRIVEHALKQAVRQELLALYSGHFGSRETPITSGEAEAMGQRYWQSLLELFHARDFATLMRAMTKCENNWNIQYEVVERLVAMVPGAVDDVAKSGVEWGRINAALTRAGETAMQAGRRSGEI